MQAFSVSHIIAWRYVKQHKRQHATSPHDGRSTALCGVHPLWYGPDTWQDDQAGLLSRPQCQRCLSIVERQQGGRR